MAADYENIYKLSLFLVDFFQIGYLRILPVICVIGSILSIICFTVFLNSKLEDRSYFYLLIKSFTDILLMLIGAFSPFVACIDCTVYNTYIRWLFALVIYKFIKNGLYLFVTVLEIIITLDRYFKIKSKTTKEKATKQEKIFIILTISLCLLIFVPVLFAEIIILKEDNSYNFETTHFGMTKFYSIYIKIIGLFENILTVFVLIPINVIVLISYKKFIKNKKTIRNLILLPNGITSETTTSIVKKTNRFTKMILISTFTFIISRLSTGSVVLLQLINDFCLNIQFYSIYNGIAQILSELVTFIIFSLNLFIYYKFNKPFRDCFKIDIICCLKQQQQTIQ